MPGALVEEEDASGVSVLALVRARPEARRRRTRMFVISATVKAMAMRDGEGGGEGGDRDGSRRGTTAGPEGEGSKEVIEE